MTSIMHRPRSTQPSEFSGQQSGKDDAQRNVPRMSTTDNANAIAVHATSSGDALSPPPPMPGMLGTGGELATLPGFFLDANPSSTSSSFASQGQASGQHTSAAEAIAGLGMGRGIFEDPAVLALAAQPFDPRTDFGLDLSNNEALAALDPSKHPSTPALPSSSATASSAIPANPRNPVSSATQASSLAGRALSDLDLTSAAGILQFPELPSSLLDQAPEYEYSVHTQANVFDAVQDYSTTGDEEAARIFGLDNYDPSLNVDGTAADGSFIGQTSQAGDDVWRFQEATYISDPQSGSSFGAHALSSGDGFVSFPDNSSMISSSEYPIEPSTAPTSRGSEWKVDPVIAGMGQSAVPSYGHQPNAKRRRESFDVRTDSGLEATFSQPGQMNNFGNAATSVYTGHNLGELRSVGGRPVGREPVVPSQGLSMQRSRIASWNGESTRFSSDNWPVSQAGGLDGGYGLQNFGGQVMGTGTADATTASAAANATAARTEMINAIGNAMDASMDSDGVAKCPYPNCSKTFAKNRSYNLKAHLRSHSQLKPFQCGHCPRAFSRKHDLERHTRVHSGDKPYLCEACGKGFPRSDALRRHWRVEKECGEKAVEIEAKQPLPSLPPGVNTPAAQAKGPMPGMMHFAAPTTTATAGLSMQVPSMMAGSGGNPFVTFHAPHHPASSSFMAPPSSWDSAMPGNNVSYGYPGMERKRAREDA